MGNEANKELARSLHEFFVEDLNVWPRRLDTDRRPTKYDLDIEGRSMSPGEFGFRLSVNLWFSFWNNPARETIGSTSPNGLEELVVLPRAEYSRKRSVSLMDYSANLTIQWIQKHKREWWLLEDPPGRLWFHVATVAQMPSLIVPISSGDLHAIRFRSKFVEFFFEYPDITIHFLSWYRQQMSAWSPVRRWYLHYSGKYAFTDEEIRDAIKEIYGETVSVAAIKFERHKLNRMKLLKAPPFCVPRS
jgi:hypothetical protein